MRKSGKMEVVYNAEGNIVLDPRDIGTYNFSSSNDAINHYLLDMGTYYRWGNAPNDSTSAIGRLIGIVD